MAFVGWAGIICMGVMIRMDAGPGMDATITTDGCLRHPGYVAILIKKKKATMRKSDFILTVAVLTETCGLKWAGPNRGDFKQVGRLCTAPHTHRVVCHNTASPVPT